MVNHAAQSRKADDLLRRKLRGVLTREEIDAAFCERHRVRYVLAEALANFSPHATPPDRLKGSEPSWNVLPLPAIRAKLLSWRVARANDRLRPFISDYPSGSSKFCPHGLKPMNRGRCPFRRLC